MYNVRRAVNCKLVIAPLIVRLTLYPRCMNLQYKDPALQGYILHRKRHVYGLGQLCTDVSGFVSLGGRSAEVKSAVAGLLLCISNPAGDRAQHMHSQQLEQLHL